MFAAAKKKLVPQASYPTSLTVSPPQHLPLVQVADPNNPNAHEALFTEPAAQTWLRKSSERQRQRLHFQRFVRPLNRATTGVI